MPIFAILLADMITVLSKFDTYNAIGLDRSSQEWQDSSKESAKIGLYFIILAVVSLFSNSAYLGLINMVSQTLTTKLRKDVYRHVVTRDMEFFDNPINDPGRLSSILTRDCLSANTVVSSTYGSMINGVSSFLCGIIISMISSWRVGLVGVLASPLIVLYGIVESDNMKEGATRENYESKESAIFQEVCVHMKTVNALNAQEIVKKMFMDSILKEHRIGNWNKILKSLLYGLGQFGQNGFFAITFFAGAQFTANNGLSYQNLYRSLLAIVFAAFGAGLSQQHAGNREEAFMSAKRILKLLETKTQISTENSKLRPEVKGRIEFKDVKFTYPTKKSPCFTSLSFTIEPKQKVAFVGPSGCGKSSIFSLLYRLYEPQEGQILIDGIDIKDIDPDHLRKSLGLVPQEPVLFDESIEYNIRYNDHTITDEQIRTAATVSSSIDYIDRDDDIEQMEDRDGKGFKRSVGLKGSKLSGGQKQRIAIARTVVRNPAVYMFDESTSALDSNSEKKVLEALSNISTDKTTLTIAHRISTIKESDLIFVIEQGKVVESGTFEELMAAKGFFYNLNNKI